MSYRLLIVSVALARSLLSDSADISEYNNCYTDDCPRQLVEKRGYPYEEHYVQTEDGYILLLGRIPQPKKGAQPVLLQHYLAGICTCFLRKNNSLAYFLYDQGYDVWFGNVRGTTFSKKHINLTTSSAEFWNYDLDAISYYDISAFVKFIAVETGQGGNIIYVGISIGPVFSLMYLLSRPEEANQLLRGLVHLAPGVYTSHSPTFELVASVRHLLKVTFGLLRIHAIFGNEKFWITIALNLCNLSPLACKIVVDLTLGKDQAEQLSHEDRLLIVEETMRPISVKELMHCLQTHAHKRFEKYDYGKIKNIEMYGQMIPPAYDLSKIKKPAFLFYGDNDKVTPAQDVKKAYEALGSKTKSVTRISTDGKIPFAHLHFTFAKDLDTLLYPHVMDVMMNYLQPIS